MCYGTEMNITEQEGADQPRLFPCLEVLDGLVIKLWTSFHLFVYLVRWNPASFMNNGY